QGALTKPQDALSTPALETQVLGSNTAPAGAAGTASAARSAASGSADAVMDRLIASLPDARAARRRPLRRFHRAKPLGGRRRNAAAALAAAMGRGSAARGSRPTARRRALGALHLAEQARRRSLRSDVVVVGVVAVGDQLSSVDGADAGAVAGDGVVLEQD